MLFDHGCDAFSIGFVIMVTSKILQVDDSNFNFFYMFGAVLVFYITTLEEYYLVDYTLNQEMESQMEVFL